MSTVSSREQTVQRLLELAREHLEMDVAWVSRFTGDEQQFLQVDAAPGATAPAVGSSSSLDGSYCIRVLDGRLPTVVRDSGDRAMTRDLPITEQLQIGSYVGVPIPDQRGEPQGMLCCTSTNTSPERSEVDLRPVRLLAQLISELTAAPAGDDALRDQVLSLIAGEGRSLVLQPIVELSTATAAGFEALTRFEPAPQRPDEWFALSARVGLRIELELAAAASALEWLDRPELTGYLSVNLSPEAVTDPRLADLLGARDLSRVVLELTEHDRIADYAVVEAALAPHRAQGLRLAVDDAGAGYASFGHILRLQPELIKADLSLIRDIDSDPARQALLSALLTLARASGARVIAEGVETQAEYDTLGRLGVYAVQGYLLARPAEQPVSEGFARVSPHVQLDAAADLTTILSEAVRDATDLESLARPLLDAMLGITGLETGYLTVLDKDEGRLEHRYIRNAGTIELPEGFFVPWSRSLCRTMQASDLLWTGQAPVDLADCSEVEEFGVQTFLSIPVLDGGGALAGTLCAVSREAVFVSDATLAQVRLIAHVLGGRFAGCDPQQARAASAHSDA